MRLISADLSFAEGFLPSHGSIVQIRAPSCALFILRELTGSPDWPGISVINRRESFLSLAPWEHKQGYGQLFHYIMSLWWIYVYISDCFPPGVSTTLTSIYQEWLDHRKTSQSQPCSWLWDMPLSTSHGLNRPCQVHAFSSPTCSRFSLPFWSYTKSSWEAFHVQILEPARDDVFMSISGARRWWPCRGQGFEQDT